MIALALVGIFCTGVGMGQIAELPGLSTLLGGPGAGGTSSMGHSVPTRISIPALEIGGEVVEVGRAGDGSIAAPVRDPAGSAGWYALGAAPGENGTAVIVGHVDTESRPAIFARLHTIAPGTPITVARRDGQQATFTVDAVERFSKTAFPADRIFGPSDHPRLALVTCGGAWLGGEIGYADNVIVFATLA